MLCPRENVSEVSGAVVVTRDVVLKHQRERTARETIAKLQASLDALRPKGRTDVHATVNGVVSPFPLAINTLGSDRRMAMSLGADSVDQVAAELGSLLNAKPPTSFKEAVKLLGAAFELRHAKPKIVRSGPCKEVIQRFDAPTTRLEQWPSAPAVTSLPPCNDATMQRCNHVTIQRAAKQCR